MRYPTQVKEKAIKRLLDKDCVPILKLSEELDIPEVTLYYWNRQLKNGNMGNQLPANLSISEKQDLLYQYQSLSESDKGIWLREKGLYSTDLENWKKEIHDILKGMKDISKKEKELKKENEKLTKELNKKDKALAEVTALLVLKKKLHALFGEEEEEENQ
jgi:transposase